jgi:hypothetical protein
MRKSLDPTKRQVWAAHTSRCFALAELGSTREASGPDGRPLARA